MRVVYGYSRDKNQLYIHCDQIAYSIYAFRSSLSSALSTTIDDITSSLLISNPDQSKSLGTILTNDYLPSLWSSVYLSDTNVIAYIDIDSAGTYTITGTQYVLNNSAMLITINNPPEGSHYYDVVLQVRTSILPPVYEFDYNTNQYSDFAYTLFKNAYRFNPAKTFSIINTNSTSQQIILPPISTVTDGTVLILKDKTGTAGTGSIVIYPGATGDVNFSTSAINANNRYSFFDTQYRPRDSTIDGQATYTINTNFVAVVLIKTNSNWYILSKYTGNCPRGAYAGGSINKSTTPTVNVLNYGTATLFHLPHPPTFTSREHPFIYIIMKHTSSVTFQVHSSRVFGPMGSTPLKSNIDGSLQSLYPVIPSGNDPACLILFTDGTEWYVVGYTTATFTAQTYNSTTASSTLTRTNNPKSTIFVNPSNTVTKLINLPDTIPATDKSSLYFVKILGNAGTSPVQIQSGTTSGITGRLLFNGRADAFRITGNYGFAWIVGCANTSATTKGYWIVASG